ncbi:MAG: hypothetical protein O3A00_23210 [Planctomycetota bacterium]|nr:hypothetical protein [Planctomycetota bacterium]
MFFTPILDEWDTKTAEQNDFNPVETLDVTSDDSAVKLETLDNIDTLGVIELILKDRDRLHRMLRDHQLQPQLFNRFMAISLIGFLFFGVAMTVVLAATGIVVELTSIETWLNTPNGELFRFTGAGESHLLTQLLSRSNLALIAAYTIGLIAATGVCLPSLYFYGLLAGVRMSVLDVTLHSLKSKATAALALVGILPVYAAIAMGTVVFEVSRDIQELTLWIGLILPFIAGIWGTHSLYRGFETVSDTLPTECRRERACFHRRLVLSWSAIYTTVTPVMIYTLWEAWQ